MTLCLEIGQPGSHELIAVLQQSIYVSLSGKSGVTLVHKEDLNQSAKGTWVRIPLNLTPALNILLPGKRVLYRVRCLGWGKGIKHTVYGEQAGVDRTSNRDGPLFLHPTPGEKSQIVQHKRLP